MSLYAGEDDLFDPRALPEDAPGGLYRAIERRAVQLVREQAEAERLAGDDGPEDIGF